jgi:hypothetical protein
MFHERKSNLGERVGLIASFGLLVGTCLWFFFWVDPDQRGRLPGWDPPPPAPLPTAGSPLAQGDVASRVDPQTVDRSTIDIATIDPSSSPAAQGGGASSELAGQEAVEGGAQRPAAAAVAGTAAAQGPHFIEGQRCGLCHAESRGAQAMRDQAGVSVAPYDLWQTSMMAQSARDPYWRAVLSAEVAATPSQKAHIEEVCTRCHAPMAAPVETSPAGQVLSFLQPSAPRAHLGLDGVSCTVCHQMTEQGFGTAESFTGRFQLNTQSLIYGPHADPFTMPMQRHVDYTPTHGPHLLQSALCATCHTVITEAVTPEGVPTHRSFHEQTPYLEWRNSIFNDEVANPAAAARSCQSCHMPTTDADGQPIVTTLAHNPGGRDFPFLEPRQPYGQHTLVGGNAFMTRLLRDNAAELGISAPAAAFDRSLAAIQTMLRQQTATVTLGPATRHGQRLHIPVTVRNLCGHKFPTAYPSRRAWLQVRVWGPDGQVVFASGRFNAQGQLLDQTDQILSSELATGPVQPHWDRIDKSDQVQIYETVMANTDGQPTFYLLHGAKFLKDNRLLPTGWQSDHADGPATAPAGIADDANFRDGSDQIVYQVPLPGSGPYRIEVGLYFQSVSPRHAAELFTHDTPEVTTFHRLYMAADHQPELIDRQEQTFSE